MTADVCMCDVVAGADAADAPVHAGASGRARLAVRGEVLAVLAGAAILPGADGAAAHRTRLRLHSAAVASCEFSFLVSFT